MRRLTATALAGLTLAVCFTTYSAIAGPAPKPSFAGSAPKAGEIAWQPDLKTAHEAARKTGKPIFIVFGAEWCTFCKKYENKTLTNPVMVGLVNREFIPVKLDYDKDHETAEILEIQSVPCTVILSPEADLLGKVVGAKEPKDLWESLQDARELQAKVKQARLAAANR